MKNNTRLNPFLNKLIHERKRQVIFIASVILLLYFRTFSFEFIGLDEQSLLLDKKNFNKELSSIPKAFTQHVFQNEHSVGSHKSIKYYRPLLTVSFIIDEQLSSKGEKNYICPVHQEIQLKQPGKCVKCGIELVKKPHFFSHRFSNMLIHFSAVIGLLFVFQQMKIPQAMSFLLSLLFAVHPLLTQAIAWIPGRNDSLVCMFVLWSFYFLLKYFQKQSRGNFVLHLLLFAGALFTKENAVMFFIICAFSIFMMYGKNLPVKNKVILLFSYSILIATWYFMRKNALQELSIIQPAAGFYHTFIKNAPLLLQCFQKTILPVNLAVMSTVEDIQYGWVLLALSLFGIALYFTKKILWVEIIFGLLWYFLFFLPTLLFSYFEGMEHRSHLPIVGLLIAFAYTDPLLNFSRNLKKLIRILGAVILVFAAITYLRVPVFSNELRYWENAAASSQHSAVVCREYGVSLMLAGDNKNAELAYLEGIRRNSKEILIHYNLGVLYFKTNRLAESENNLLQELSIDSTTNALTYHILGVICKETGRMQEAVERWNKVLTINPNFEPAKNELMNYYRSSNSTKQKP